MSSGILSQGIDRRRVIAGTAALAGLGLVGGRAAAKIAGKPVTFYSPLPAGGLIDTHMRFLGERAGKRLGVPVVVDYRLGAAATLAAANVANAKPDGHSIALMTVNSLRYPHYQQTSWHPLNDLTYIIGLSTIIVGIVVHPDSPYRTIDDLIAAGKRQPGHLNFGTTGPGGSGHLLSIDLDQAVGAKFTHVPYKGGPETVQALLAREIDFMCDGAAWAPAVDGGLLRLLAVATEKRIARYPDVPTLKERGYDATAWSPYGIVGPKNMPADIVRELHDAFKSAMEDPGHEPLLQRFLQESWYRSGAEYRKWAEDYFVEIRPKLMKAGLAKS
jgi:tripartite-type tricarboxylate transporter receptor subunit TctC